MHFGWPLVVLVGIVVLIVGASARPAWQPVFRWLPIPLWCYGVPMILRAIGWLPVEHPSYGWAIGGVLPVALGLLLLGVDLPSVLRSGRKALMAAIMGALAIVVGTPLGVWVLQAHLPPEAWKGAGALTGTWTGGTMNLVALRSILEIPEPIFASLILVDAMVAYSWMALLVMVSGFQEPINQWLHARIPQVDPVLRVVNAVEGHEPRPHPRDSLIPCALVAMGLALGARWIAPHLPTSQLVSSSTGWTVLLVTTATVGLSLMRRLRRIGKHGASLGYPCLYLVLAATGAQARLDTLWSAPAWIVLASGVVFFHGAALLLVGRLFRIPLGLLATASQANIGGAVSAPLVGAVYHQSLAPVGLLLALAGNALGTYLGWLSASFCRWLT